MKNISKFEERARMELERITQEGLRRRLTCVSSAETPFVRIDGKQYVSFASNDYLGLANAPELRHAAEHALREFPFGGTSSRLVAGHTVYYEELEKELALLKDKPRALVFTTGYSANLGIVSTITEPSDLIFSDEANHASLIDGCRLSRAKVVVYRHSDVNHLEELLKAESSSGARKLVITDSVFSVEGDVAPLKEVVAVAERYGASVLVDDAHATGVFGPAGAGMPAHLGLTDRVEFITATLSKAGGLLGGFVSCSEAVAELLISRSRPFIFTTALPAALCAAAIASVKMLKDADLRRKELWDNIHYLGEKLLADGFLASMPQSPIFTVNIGDNHRALEARERLSGAGIMAAVFRPPTTPRACLRLSLTAMHTIEHLENLRKEILELRAEKII